MDLLESKEIPLKSCFIALKTVSFCLRLRHANSLMLFIYYIRAVLFAIACVFCCCVSCFPDEFGGRQMFAVIYTYIAYYINWTSWSLQNCKYSQLTRTNFILCSKVPFFPKVRVEILKCVFFRLQIIFIVRQSQVEHNICRPTFASNYYSFKRALKQLQEKSVKLKEHTSSGYTVIDTNTN